MSATVGPIEAFMTEDHARLDAFLAEATAGETIDAGKFAEFREGLLRHIGMEEKILVPLLRGRSDWPHAPVLRRDHGVIAKLLVPTPSASSCDALREVLSRHNPIEEGSSGLYAACDAAVGAEEAAAVVARLRAVPRVPVAKHYDGPLLRKL